MRIWKRPANLLILALGLAFLANAHSEDEVHLNSCFDGPFYRNLVGTNVITDAALTKLVYNGGRELIECRVGAASCNLPEDNYTCILKFMKLTGDDAQAVFSALSDNTRVVPGGEKKVQLAVAPAAPGSCAQPHCELETYLVCSALNCRVVDEVTGSN